MLLLMRCLLCPQMRRLLLLRVLLLVLLLLLQLQLDLHVLQPRHERLLQDGVVGELL